MASRSELSAFLENVERRAFKQAVFAVRDEEAALDIVQDAMLRLAEKYGHRPAEELPLLFHRIVQNAIRDWFRRQKVRSLWTTLLSSLSPSRGEDDEQDPLEFSAHRFDHSQNFHWIHSVRFDCHRGCIKFVQIGQIRLNRIQCAGCAAPRGGINQNCQILFAIEQRISEIKTANAEINDAYFLWQRLLVELASDLAAKGIVTEKDVADSGDQDSGFAHRRFLTGFT